MDSEWEIFDLSLYDFSDLKLQGFDISITPLSKSHQGKPKRDYLLIVLIEIFDFYSTWIMKEWSRADRDATC